MQEGVMMESNEAGLAQVIVERLQKQRLPRALALKAMVDRGEVLGDLDIEFLGEVFKDAGKLAPFLDRHPEWQELAGSMMHLYSEITGKALENQQRAEGGPSAY
jgi:hypothetical protein